MTTPEQRTEPEQEVTVMAGAARLYQAMWQFASGKRWMMIAALGLLVGSQVIKLAIPYLAAQAINTLQSQGLQGSAAAGAWLLMMLVVTALSWAMHGPGRVLERNVALVVRERVSANLVNRLITLPLSWHDSNHSGSAAHRVQQSARALYDFTQSQYFYLQNIVRLVGPVVALALLDPLVGALAFIGLLLISVCLAGFDRAMIRLAHLENDQERRYASALIDGISNAASVAALRQGPGISKLIEQRLRAIFSPLKRSIVVNESKWCAVDLLSLTLCCLLLAVYVWRLSTGNQAAATTGAAPITGLALGNLYMVWEYSLQAGGVITAVAAQFQAFARQHADYASADAIISGAENPAGSSLSVEAGARMETRNGVSDRPTVLTPSRRGGGETINQEWQQLGVYALNFSHQRRGDRAGAAGPSDTRRAPEQTLHNLTLQLQRGRRYALVGASGSGKSTLLKVLAGLYVADSLRLELDSNGPFAPGHAADWLRANATLIPQDAEVIEATLFENLALCAGVNGPPHADEFAPALEAACATEFVNANQQGLHIQIAERGSNWSGGQRQRIALARGVLAANGSGLIMLDEPTAALDPHTEQEVLRRLLSVFKPACIVASVHRLNLLPFFDEVIFMDCGQVRGIGKIEQLASQNPQFAGMLAAGQAL